MIEESDSEIEINDLEFAVYSMITQKRYEALSCTFANPEDALSNPAAKISVGYSCLKFLVIADSDLNFEMASAAEFGECHQIYNEKFSFEALREAAIKGSTNKDDPWGVFEFNGTVEYIEDLAESFHRIMKYKQVGMG
jgi:hypothetical protein